MSQPLTDQEFAARADEALESLQRGWPISPTARDSKSSFRAAS